MTGSDALVTRIGNFALIGRGHTLGPGQCGQHDIRTSGEYGHISQSRTCALMLTRCSAVLRPNFSTQYTLAGVRCAPRPTYTQPHDFILILKSSCVSIMVRCGLECFGSAIPQRHLAKEYIIEPKRRIQSYNGTRRAVVVGSRIF